MKKILFPLIFILLAISVYAEQVYIDTVSYTEPTSNGWSFSSSCSNHTGLSVPSYFGSYAIGSNFTTPCVDSFIDSWVYEFDEPLDIGYLSLEYDIALLGTGANEFNPIGLRVDMPTNMTGSTYIIFWGGDGFYNNEDFRADCDSWAEGYGCVDCHFGDMSGVKDKFNGTVSVRIDMINRSYNYSLTLEDGSFYSCSNTWSYTYFNIESFSIVQQWSNGWERVGYIDNMNFNIDVSLANVSSNLATGYPCTSDNQCLSGKCQGGYCVLRNGQEGCTYDYQCLSGLCVNGKCTRAGLFERIDAGKTATMGDSVQTNNFLALIISIIIAGAIMVSGKSRQTAIAGSIIFFALQVFFAIVGWLSPFILFGEFFIAVAGVVLLMVLAGKE